MDELNFDQEQEQSGNITGFVMPSSPADRKKIMDAMDEISASKTRVEAERDFQKGAIQELYDSFKIPKRLLNRFAKSHHKSAFAEELAIDSDFETLVDALSRNQSL